MIATAREIYARRELLGVLVWRELKARYKGSVIGYAWSMLSPLVLLAVYTLVFSSVLKAEIVTRYLEHMLVTANT